MSYKHFWQRTHLAWASSTHSNARTQIYSVHGISLTTLEQKKIAQQLLPGIHNCHPHSPLSFLYLRHCHKLRLRLEQGLPITVQEGCKL